MAVLQTTIGEVKAREYSARSVRLNRIYAEINFAKKKLISLQQELGILKSSELLTLQQMNRYTKLDQIEHLYSSDRYQTNDPVQSLRPVDRTFPDPDARINITQTQLTKGMVPMQAELDRASAEVKRVSQDILQYQHVLEVNEKLLISMGANVQQQLLKDNIAKRSYAELYMLYEVANQYRTLTLTYSSSSSKGSERIFTSDPSLVRKLNRYQQMFEAYAERTADVLNGDLKLDMDDPGSDNNIKTLKEFLDRRRQLLGGEGVTFDKELKNYSDQLESQMSDTTITQNVSRQSDAKRVPDADNALVNHTTRPNNFVENLNRKQNEIFGLAVDNTSPQYPRFYLYFDPKFKKSTDGVKENFRRQVSKLNGGKPFCDPVPSSADETNKAQADAQQKAQEAAAGQSLSTQFSRTKKSDNTQIVLAIDNLIQDLSNTIENGKVLGSNPVTGYFPSTSLLQFNNNEYFGTLNYHVRIANSAKIAIDFIDGQWLLGNITTEDREAYYKKIETLLKGVSPPFKIVPIV